MYRAGKARHPLFFPDDQEVHEMRYPDQLPCGCYEGEECFECSPWGPSIVPLPGAADQLREAQARRAHLEAEADAQQAAA